MQIYFSHYEQKGHALSESHQEHSGKKKTYWSENLRLIFGCLIVWLTVSIGFSILFRPALSGIKIGGTDLGFWFAQQGSILCFLAIIFFYAWRMNKLDKKYDVPNVEPEQG